MLRHIMQLHHISIITLLIRLAIPNLLYYDPLWLRRLPETRMQRRRRIVTARAKIRLADIHFISLRFRVHHNRSSRARRS